MALATQFLKLHPATTYDLLDIWTTDGCRPYKNLVPTYTFLSAHPRLWRFLYHLSNTTPYAIMMNLHTRFMCERKIRKTIASFEADVVVSVHPTMTAVPQHSLRKIERRTGRHTPIFTVVTDLGSGHCTWFTRRCEKMFVASTRIRRLARRRGWVSNNKLVMSGLPIRESFATQAAALNGDRHSKESLNYVGKMRDRLGIDPIRKVVLVMGGGEGVGSLGDIVDELYNKLTDEGTKATVVVVCGRNEKLKKDLEGRDWVLEAEPKRGKRERVKKRLRRGAAWVSGDETWVKNKGLVKTTQTVEEKKNVHVIGLGFVKNMDEWMVASDVLLSKAGPGSIAEAASVGLPIMLTSFLPGQEAGNVDVVVDGGERARKMDHSR